MKQTVSLLERGFESSAYTTPEFLAFVKTFKKEFTKELQSIGATDIQIGKGHFYVSGFFTVNGQPYYFSVGDVRWMMPMPFVSGFAMLYRTARDYKDYTGGANHHITIETGMAKKFQLR